MITKSKETSNDVFIKNEISRNKKEHREHINIVNMKDISVPLVFCINCHNDVMQKQLAVALLEEGLEFSLYPSKYGERFYKDLDYWEVIRKDLFSDYELDHKSSQWDWVKKNYKEKIKGRYVIQSMLWMNKYIDFMRTDSDKSYNWAWYYLLGLISGPIPDDLPSGCSFFGILKDCFDGERIDYIHRTVEQYFKENPDSLDAYSNPLAPGFPSITPILDESIGFTHYWYYRYALKLKELKALETLNKGLKIG